LNRILLICFGESSQEAKPGRTREPGQPYSDKAQKYLASLVLNKTVDIKGYGSDRYGRILGVVSLNGKNINLEMIRAGLAEVYRGDPPRGLDMAPFHEAEKQAREAKRGRWSRSSGM
jgi:micrococcal nuclease